MRQPWCDSMYLINLRKIHFILLIITTIIWNIKVTYYVDGPDVFAFRGPPFADRWTNGANHYSIVSRKRAIGIVHFRVYTLHMFLNTHIYMQAYKYVWHFQPLKNVIINIFLSYKSINSHIIL